MAEPEGFLRYTAEAVQEPLREVDTDLQMFDCVACGNCVTVCPNNAFLAVPTGVAPPLKARSQYLVLAELCNECGNCVTFCPERGAPWEIKPRLYTDEAAWTARGREGVLVEASFAGRADVAATDPSASVRRLCGTLAWLKPSISESGPRE